MRLSSILLLATAVYAKSTPSSFDYEFNCNDKNSFCVHVRKQLTSAISSLSSIFGKYL